MHQLITSGCGALVYSAVFNEAIAFKRVYEELKAKIGEENIPYVGYIRPDMLEPLHHRFKRVYEELKAKIGEENFPYVGYIRPDILEPLHHRFKWLQWLHTASILWAKYKGHVGDKYTMTGYPVDAKQLTRGEHL